MNVAITGASGYLGQGLVKAFQARGHKVLTLTRRPCGSEWVFYALDMDPTELPLSDVDVLVHAAWDFSIKSWDEMEDKNIRPSSLLFEVAAKAGVGRLIFISSMSSHERAPSNYGRAKAQVERGVAQLGGIVVRPGLVWGDGSGGVMGAMERLLEVSPVVPFPVGRELSSVFMVNRVDLSEKVTDLVSEYEISQIRLIAHSQPWPIGEVLKVASARMDIPRLLIPVPWKLVHFCLRLCERVHMRLPLKSDSLLSLTSSSLDPVVDLLPMEGGLRSFDLAP